MHSSTFKVRPAGVEDRLPSLRATALAVALVCSATHAWADGAGGAGNGGAYVGGTGTSSGSGSVGAGGTGASFFSSTGSAGIDGVDAAGNAVAGGARGQSISTTNTGNTTAGAGSNAIAVTSDGTLSGGTQAIGGGGGGGGQNVYSGSASNSSQTVGGMSGGAGGDGIDIVGSNLIYSVYGNAIGGGGGGGGYSTFVLSGGGVNANYHFGSLSGGSGGIGVSITGASVQLNNSGLIAGGGGGGGGYIIENITASGVFTTDPPRGGDGGVGVSVSGAGAAIVNAGSIAGGNGGVGGMYFSTVASQTHGGDGGDGGSGILLNSTSAILTNTGVISGGTGGSATTGSVSGSNGSGGAGVVISGSGNTVINAGSISGGVSGSGATSTTANAVSVTGNNNTVGLQSGYSFTGNVVSTGSNNTLSLGGATDASFNLADIAASNPSSYSGVSQYYGFANYSKTGTSTWTLTGSSSGTAGWSVNQGTLLVNGSLASAAMTVNNGGTLGGTGTVGATTVASGGTLAADTLGSGLTVNGNLNLSSGSTYRVAADNTGNSGLVTVNGNLILSAGSTLQMVASAGSYTAGTSYTIANYTGTANGAFTTLNHNFAYLTPTVTYGTNSISVLLNTSSSFQSAGFLSAAGSANQQAVANALNKIYNAGGNTFTSALVTASDSQAKTALAAASGDVAASAVQQADANIQSAQQAIGQRLAAIDVRPGGAPVDEDPWISVSLTRQHRSTGDAGSSAYDNHGAIVSFGHDQALSPDWLLGFAFSANSDRTDYRDVSSSGRSDGLQAALYARYRPEGSAFFVKGIAGLGLWSNQLDRQLSVGSYSSNVRGKYNVRSTSVYGEAGYTFDGPHLILEPYAALSTSLTWRPAYAESTQSGSGGFALAYGGQRTTQSTSVLGLRLHQTPAQGSTVPTTQWQSDLSWRHRLGNNESTVQAAFVNAADDSFLVRGSPQGRDEVVLQAGVSIPVAASAAAFGQAGASVGKGYQSYGVQAGMRWWW